MLGFGVGVEELDGVVLVGVELPEVEPLGVLVPGVGVVPLPGGVGVEGVGTEPDGFGASAGFVGGGVVLPGAGVVVVGGEPAVGFGSVELDVADGLVLGAGVVAPPAPGVGAAPAPGAAPAAGGGALAFTISVIEVLRFNTLS